MCQSRNLLVLALALVVFGCSGAAPAQTSATWQLALRFHRGERIVEHTYQNDRIDWKLPEHLLKRFEAEGVIVHEERHITLTINASVISVTSGAALLHGTVSTISVDVPRHHQTLVSQDPFVAAITRANKAVTMEAPYVEDAAMAGFPAHPVNMGQQWQTHLKVMTNLGSGTATFTHRVTGFEDGRLQIAVSGSGFITGLEYYHLPELLPGTITMHGTAWYDPAAGLVVQESYSIRNRIIRPMEGEESGFDERLNVDSNTRAISP